MVPIFECINLSLVAIYLIKAELKILVQIEEEKTAMGLHPYYKEPYTVYNLLIVMPHEILLREIRKINT